MKLLNMMTYNKTVNIIFLIFAQNMDCGYSLELLHLGGSNNRVLY